MGTTSNQMLTSMVKTPASLCVLAALTVSSALAQEPANPNAGAAPIPPVVAPATPPAGPATPAAPTAPAAPSTPAPIEPPITPSGQPGIPPAVGTPATPGTPGIPGTLPPDASAAPTLPPTAARLNDFQGDPIDLVLRTLARQAKMNIVVSDKVAQSGGTVNMRIEGKSPREAIEIIVESKGLVMDQGKNDVYFIKTPEEKAKEPTESGSFTLSYATAEKVVPLLKTQLQSGVEPQVDVRTNTVFFRENRSNMEKIQLFLNSIDRPTQQVMIEARLVEVTANPQQSYGINWGGVVGSASSPQTFRYGGSTAGTSVVQQAQNVSTTVSNGVTTQTTTPILNALGLPVTGVIPSTVPQAMVNTTSGTLAPQDFLLNGATKGGFGDAIAGQFAILSLPSMSATLRLLNEDADTQFLAHPRVVTSNNMKATIKILREQPVPQLNFNEQTAQAVFSGFQTKEFGNTLTVTPSINKDDFITMSVQPEISNKVADATFTFSGATVTSPIIDKRTLDSNVLIKSGDTLAIGGLLQDEQTKTTTKVPILGDIPIIGYAFQERLNSRTKRNLLVFVTPTIIKQGYGTGLEDQVTGLNHSGNEYADPNGWRNNAKGAARLMPTSNRQLAADYPRPGIPPAPTTPAPRKKRVRKPKATPAPE
jgi:type IV pilus secretin PilQ/predicted competence protein